MAVLPAQALGSPESYLKQFRVEVCSEKYDLKDIISVVNAAYQKHMYLQRERLNTQELQEILADPKKRLYLCLSPNGKVCGTVFLNLHYAKEAELGLLSVDPAYQGKKLGDLLLQHAEDDAFKTYSLEKVVLEVVQCMEKLVAYYQSRGYVRTAEVEFPEKSWLKPEWQGKIKCFLMEKIKNNT
jgi:ribosomal protein S18 acetylase RimI-like enzyme